MFPRYRRDTTTLPIGSCTVQSSKAGLPRLELRGIFLCQRGLWAVHVRLSLVCWRGWPGKSSREAALPPHSSFSPSFLRQKGPLYVIPYCSLI